MRSLCSAIMATVLSATVHAGDAQDVNGMGVDILVMSLVKDVQDHVLYIQLSQGATQELSELLEERLASKLFDLANYVQKTSNPQVVGLVCRSTMKLDDDIKELTRACERSNAEQICDEYSRLSKFCGGCSKLCVSRVALRG